MNHALKMMLIEEDALFGDIVSHCRSLYYVYYSFALDTCQCLVN